MDSAVQLSPECRFQLPPPSDSVLQNTLGAILVSGLVTTALYGISCLQCFIFFQSSSKRQHWLLSPSVWAIWILDTTHLAIFVGHTLYWYLIKNYGKELSLLELPWSVPAGIIITTVSDGIVRFWFTYRVWILSGQKKWLVLPLLVCQLMLWGAALASGIKGLSLHTFMTFAHISWLLYFSFGLIIVTDFYIATTLCYYLYRSRRGTVCRKTESIINMLIIYTVNTGLLTSLVSVVTLILFISHPHDYGFIGIYFVLEKLYVNSLLASLNIRDWLHNDSNTITLPGGTVDKGNHGRAAFVNVQPTDTQSSEPSTSDLEVGVGVRIHVEEKKSVI